jgi:hypothetical protein
VAFLITLLGVCNKGVSFLNLKEQPPVLTHTQP